MSEEENGHDLEIPTELYEELEAAAVKLGMSVTQFVEEAIVRWLKDPGIL